MLENAQSIIGYTFTDASILWEALQAPGAPRFDTNGRDFSNGQKRLALVGDAVLKLVLLDEWYRGPRGIRKFTVPWTSESERSLWTTFLGDCSSSRAVEIGNNQVATIGSNSNLAQTGRSHSLDTCIHNNPSAWGAVSNGVMAQTVEAILGAVWLDSGAGPMGAVTAVMNTLGLTAT